MESRTHRNTRKALTSNQVKAHRYAVKHLADYVLIWAGGGGDDLAKSPPHGKNR